MTVSPSALDQSVQLDPHIGVSQDRPLAFKCILVGRITKGGVAVSNLVRCRRGHHAV